MKKLFLFFLTCSYLSVFAQHIRIFQNNKDLTGSTVFEKIEANKEYQTDFKLFNNSAAPVKFAVQRILKTKLAAGYTVFFGAGCLHTAPYEDSVYTYVDSAIFVIDGMSYLPATTNCFGLTGFLYTGPACTDHTVVYRIWDLAKPSELSEITIHYSCTLGMNKYAAGSFSTAFPNPAMSNTTIDYALNSLSENPTLVLYDVLGKAWQTIPLTKKEGKAELSTEELPSGLYFCRFIVNDKPVHTSKLIVNH